MYEKQVKAGADWLDRTHPGWEWRVDLQSFDMSDPSKCVLGQQIGYLKADMYFLTMHSVAVQQGLILPYSILDRLPLFASAKDWKKIYSGLTKAWVQEIKRRRRAVDAMREAVRKGQTVIA